MFVHLNCCPYYSHLSWKGRKLKKAGLLYSTWQARTGPIMVKLNEDSKPQKIIHEDDLDQMFPGFDYEENFPANDERNEM